LRIRIGGAVDACHIAREQSPGGRGDSVLADDRIDFAALRKRRMLEWREISIP
jgi:hypothetical protein